MKVGIVGGGITGITLAYYLSRAGADVDVFEASSELGGLAGPLRLPDGTLVDRFYHAILPSDDQLHALCEALNLTDQLRFTPTQNAFFVNGVTASMNSAVEFLRFSPLSLLERFRLGLTIARAQFVRDWRRLESVSVHDWLKRWSGRGVFEKLWVRMLDAKFENGHERIPATWMWSRLVRMKSTRSGASQRESAGHIVGGYATLLKAMADQVRAHGGRIHLNCPVEEILIHDGQATGIRTRAGMWRGQAIVSTMQAPVFSRLVPGAPPSYRESLSAVPYLGVVCPLVVLDRPLTGYWVLNLADATIPFTGVIETTTFIDPALVGGHHLVYLPKYTAPDSRWQRLSDEEIRAEVLATLKRLVPTFDETMVRYILIHRERYVEPLHRLDGADPIPAVETPIRNLYLATTAQIYPALTNGESVTQHARAIADIVLDRLVSAGAAQASGSSVAIL
jgi:protoporphyrinogen oxidase